VARGVGCHGRDGSESRSQLPSPTSEREIIWPRRKCNARQTSQGYKLRVKHSVFYCCPFSVFHLPDCLGSWSISPSRSGEVDPMEAMLKYQVTNRRPRSSRMIIQLQFIGLMVINAKEAAFVTDRQEKKSLETIYVVTPA